MKLIFFFFFLIGMLLNKDNVLLNTEDERETLFWHGFIILSSNVVLSVEYQYWNQYSWASSSVDRLQVWRWYRTEGRGWYTRGMCCHSEKHWQTGKMGWQAPLLNIEKSKFCTCAGKHCHTSTAWGLTRRLAGRKDPGVPDEVSSILLCIRQSALSRSRKVILSLSTGEATSKSCIQFWATQYKRDTDVLEWVQWKATKLVKDLEHLS